VQQPAVKMKKERFLVFIKRKKMKFIPSFQELSKYFSEKKMAQPPQKN